MAILVLSPLATQWPAVFTFLVEAKMAGEDSFFPRLILCRDDLEIRITSCNSVSVMSDWRLNLKKKKKIVLTPEYLLLFVPVELS